MKKIFIISICFLFLLTIFGCKKTDTGKDFTVFVSILPQKYFVEKIAGERLKVEVLVSPGKSPHSYEPTPQQVISLGGAKALFTIGVPFEKAFLPKIKNTIKSIKIVDTSFGINKRVLELHSHDDDHEGEEEDEHEIGTPDPHIWLSPSLAKIMAKNIYKALIEIDPNGEAEYSKAYKSLIEELDDLISLLSETLKPFEGSILFVYHPAFGYFADEFGLKQVTIEIGGKEPSPAKLTEIIDRAQKNGVKVIFVQPEFSQESAKKIAYSINGAVVILNPLSPDYINNLKIISQEIKTAFNNK